MIEERLKYLKYCADNGNIKRGFYLKLLPILAVGQTFDINCHIKNRQLLTQLRRIIKNNEKKLGLQGCFTVDFIKGYNNVNIGYRITRVA